MTRGSLRAGEFGFLEALLKRGFINIPRMLFDYMLDLGLDYDRIGRIYSLLACVGGPGESAFGAYTVTRRTMPRDFDQVRSLAVKLQEGDHPVTMVHAATDNEITFSFLPLYARLQGTWDEYRLKHEEEEAQTGGPHPAVALAERLIGRPLSDRDLREVLDWVEEFKFGPEMVEAVILEGKRQGVTRMGYLKAIAKGWAEAGVQTPQQAAAYIQEHQKAAAKYRHVTQALGIMRPLTASEQGVLERWFIEWGFHDEVIMAACERAVGSKNPLQYTNKVLESWLAEGVRTSADLERMVEQRKRTAAAGADPGRTGGAPNRKPPTRPGSTVRREKKDESFYDQIYKKFED